jgi:branched-chain amino acid transport system substrate-binding protein
VLAKYIHSHTFKTVVGDLAFGKDGEWAKPRMVLTQFQNIEPNNAAQFKDGSKQPILWPPEYATGKMIYPYADARKK